MRLPERLKIIIKKSLNEIFGPADIYLFGSRTDDTKKGGDIDICINVDLSRNEFRAKKIKFIASLMKQGFDLKIDLVSYKQNDELFFNEIKMTAIKL